MVINEEEKLVGLKTNTDSKVGTGPMHNNTNGGVSVSQNTGTVPPKVWNQSSAGLEVRKDSTTTFYPDWKVAQTFLSRHDMLFTFSLR